ncbi:hypothetical protein COEREDRAFT_81731 [Coemansia reversa NRRL 1564]|uniref:ARM repeat-containing protein n=1 Tax=Coemansia reversa (strain ATCC 12441 / NRRL 1564) TaxID=763665 RepID=A0A2G5B9V3_COERN|nr:hypothetical protein COEREDRAFT_81731 [Coemansia reversa NRRL 1564]|eukprot:PIA15791.1 hypothetical protein COEREDRAFT_81731 [Coemansia reversa NRRL 1564]
MQLFLTSPKAAQQLVEWNIALLLGKCLQVDSDPRVSSVAIRFLGSSIVSNGGTAVWQLLNSEGTVTQWVVQNADSPHVLVRLSCLYFARKVAQVGDAAAEKLLSALDYPRLILRRLLDASFFVVGEACRLLGELFCRNGGVADPELCALVERLVSKPVETQSSQRKVAVLAAIEALYVAQGNARAFVVRLFTLDRLQSYLFDVDRTVRDRALDVLEHELVQSELVSVAELVCMLEKKIRNSGDRRTSALVTLRCLSAAVKRALENPNTDCAIVSEQCLCIAQSALAHLQGIKSSTMSAAAPAGLAEIDSNIRELLAGTTDPALHATANAIVCESARIVREFCKHTFDQPTVTALLGLLEEVRVQRNPLLLQLILDALIHALRLANKIAGPSHLHAVPELIANFAIGSTGLKSLYALALEVISDAQSKDAELHRFILAVARSAGMRLVDVEWEARDTTLELIAAATTTLDWDQAHVLVGGLIDDIVVAVNDTEEYVRASASQALVAIVSRADNTFVQQMVIHQGLGRNGLEQLINDSEAFVKRAALDLVYAIGNRCTDAIKSTEWVRSVSYEKLYQLADDPDFEVRVRCARLAALLVTRQYFGHNNDHEYLCNLQSSTILLYMCGDTSRYVRGVCLESLTLLKKRFEVNSAKADASTHSRHQDKRRQTDKQLDDSESLYNKLCEVDFGRLEASLSPEHLYQEALDTQVEKELMKESHDPNVGNNILDCY